MKRKFFLFLMVVLVSITLVPGSASGHILYFTADYTMGASIDESSDYNNGVGCSDFGLSIGRYFGRIGIEGFYKKLNMADEVTAGPGTFNVKITDEVLGLSFRFPFYRFGVLKAGYAIHDIEADYDLIGSSQTYASTIDGDGAGILLGLGFKFPFLGRYEYYTDFLFMHIKKDLNFAAIDAGIRVIF